MNGDIGHDSHPQNGLANGGVTFRAEFFVFDGSEHLKRLRFAERGDMAAETFLEILVGSVLASLAMAVVGPPIGG